MEEFIDPVIEFKEKNRTVKISGVSMMEDALEFYKECKNWIDDYLNSNSDPLIIEFELTYFNSSTAKQFIQILSKLEDGNNKGKAVWKYPKDHIIMYDRGKELEALVDVPFEFIEL